MVDTVVRHYVFSRKKQKSNEGGRVKKGEKNNFESFRRKINEGDPKNTLE